jgi:DNA replication and repair protein RecF
MHLENLTLLNFKNYLETGLNFSEGLNYIFGKNGSGKTNLLDAIHYLSIGRSAFNHVDQLNINHEAGFFMVAGNYRSGTSRHRVSCSLERGKKKIISVDQKPVTRISEFIGRYPSVLIAPDDIEIINSGGEERRKFFDLVFSQIDSSYLSNLIRYNQILKERNSLLKSSAERGKVDKVLFETYDSQILELAESIYTTRKNLLEDFYLYFQKQYQLVSGSNEVAEILYESDVSDSEFRTKFSSSFRPDLAAQRTLLGIHKDDYNFQLDNFPVKKFGSQGQKKSFLLALKLAQFFMLEQETEKKPLLLLDDIFDKLDEDRIGKLVQNINEGAFGQIFLTDAKSGYANRFLQEITQNKLLIAVENGRALIS